MFCGNNGVTGEEPWRTNGTADGTRTGNETYFQASETGGRRLWWTDDTGAETQLVTGWEGPGADGVANPLKYALGIDGSTPYHALPGSGPGQLPDFSVTQTGEESALKVTYRRRVGSGLQYTAQ